MLCKQKGKPENKNAQIFQHIQLNGIYTLTMA